MNSPRRVSAWIREAAPAVAALLATASYLMALAAYYRWWVWILVAPLALLGAMVATTLLWLTAGSWLLQILWIGCGLGLVYTGVTEPGRAGSILMGLALILIGAVPADIEASSADRDESG